MSAQKPVFAAIPPELDFPRYEREILELWRRERIFERSLDARGEAAKSFVFYEGPPTANGLPHNGHVLTRVMKDLFPRYQAMRGRRVLRKGGWDTHGLPVEVEVEKELRIHGKAAIQEYGVEPFVRRCIESVFRYTTEWERLTERIGFWVSLPDAYVTFHKSYVESVWWALSRLFQSGLLYQSHKVVWWWAQGGTALSNGEVGLGYKTVKDPSVYVAFPLVDDAGAVTDTALVVWTTTPWTLPSNFYAAARPGTSYDVVTLGAPLPKATPRDVALGGTRKLIVASALRAALEQRLGRELQVVQTLAAEALAGRRYLPPFDGFLSELEPERTAGGRAPLGTLSRHVHPLFAGGAEGLYWKVILADFVALDTGTGIVHIAPAFGEDDHRAYTREWDRYAAGKTEPPPGDISAVQPDGAFDAHVSADASLRQRFVGRWVKDCDKDIIAWLAAQGALVFDELYEHEYPFCWRSDQDPLIQMARPAWFIRTTARLDVAKADNQAVNWLPDHIKTGRFGDFLENNVDWALSRERFWGTPLNVWICDACGAREAPASSDELLRRNARAFDHWYAAKAADPTLSEHLMVHKPWIDQVTYACSARAGGGTCSGTCRRVPEVIDCWFDSGCMPFAQWGFPHVAGSLERFDAAFPAQFISEAIDQTRGWFYSLLMISSLLFDEETQKALGLSRVRQLPHPFETCIVLGHVADREGKKESKSRGNYTPPEIILDRVSMDFGVVTEVAGDSGEEGVALIAREDLEGMDLADGARVVLYRSDAPSERREVTLRAHKKLPRRVVLLAATDRALLGVTPTARGLATQPVEVPRLPVLERVTLEDPSTPAPGADAFRWFFYASSPPWNNTRHSLRNVRTLQKDYLVKLRNVLSFFVIYANIDGFDPRRHVARPVPERALLDRWIASEVALATSRVRAALDAYLPYDAALVLTELVESLSNWYVRRSRTRFWAPGLEADKVDAYVTLHECLTTLARLTAPFTPFFAEELWQNLVRGAGLPGAADSVHLADFPEPASDLADPRLAEEMRALREIVSLGLAVRTSQKLKVRQPLAAADVVFNDAELMRRVEAHKSLAIDELNVHELRFMLQRHEQGAVTFKLKPNFRALGPRLGKDVQTAKRALEAADAAALYAALAQRGEATLALGDRDIVLGPDDIEVVVGASEGFAAETGKIGVVVVHTTLTPELVDEGYLREITSRVQAERKELGLAFDDRVRVSLAGSARIERVASQGRAHLASECLAVEIEIGAAPEGAREHAIGDEVLRVSVARSAASAISRG